MEAMQDAPTVMPEMTTAYYIKNRDRVLGQFHWVDDNTPQLDENIGLPEFITKDFGRWVREKGLYHGRTFGKHVCALCGIQRNLKSYLDYARGISLTDTLWITSNLAETWDLFNPYINQTGDELSSAFLACTDTPPTESPRLAEFTLDGHLPKCWVYDGGIQLAKAGTRGGPAAGFEPLAEAMASQVLDALQYPHVSYRVGVVYNRRVSICPIISSENVMLQSVRQRYTFSNFDELRDAMVKDGLEIELAQALVFDYLSCNHNRHAKDFSILLNSETFESYGLAPLHDHGFSMLSSWDGKSDIYTYTDNLIPALYPDFESGARYGVQVLGSQLNAERLLDFQFDLSKLGNYQPKRIMQIQSWLQYRVRKLLSL